jgi:mRNA-degrading endonuclease toxin of MazEF toxin-antitoxin module
MKPKPGEVWLVDLGLAAKTRPVVIVSRYDPTPPRALVLYPVELQLNRLLAVDSQLECDRLLLKSDRSLSEINLSSTFLLRLLFLQKEVNVVF